MAKIFVQTERMKKDFKEFEENKESFTQEDLNHTAEELVYFAEYAVKNKIKTIYDLEEKLRLPFEAYFDGFEKDCLDSEDLDYSPALTAYKKVLSTFMDDFLFEEETISFITTMYFRTDDMDAAEAFMKGFLEGTPDSALGYATLIHGFMDVGEDAKAKEYYDMAKGLSLDQPELIPEV